MYILHCNKLLATINLIKILFINIFISQRIIKFNKQFFAYFLNYEKDFLQLFNAEKIFSLYISIYVHYITKY